MNREEQQKQPPAKVSSEASKEFEKNGQEALTAVARAIMVQLAWIKAGLFDPSNT